MQTHAIQNPQPQFPIQELEQIEAAIQASLRLVATLEDRKTTLGAELERITQPTTSGFRSTAAADEDDPARFRVSRRST